MKNRIQEFRESLGLNRKQFAEMVGIKPQMLQNYELGNNVPGLDKLEQIAKPFGLNPAWLVGWIDEEKPETNKTERVCYVADGPTRIPPYLDTDAVGHTVRWKKSGIKRVRW